MADEYRITHALVEGLRGGNPDARITHALVEVLRTGERGLSSVDKILMLF